MGALGWRFILFYFILFYFQVSKGLAYPVNGLVMGALDWRFLTASMWLCNMACCSVVYFFKPVQTIGTIWYGLFTFMSMQCITGLIRIVSGTGVWKGLYFKDLKAPLSSSSLPPPPAPSPPFAAATISSGLFVTEIQKSQCAVFCFSLYLLIRIGRNRVGEGRKCNG